MKARPSLEAWAPKTCTTRGLQVTTEAHLSRHSCRMLVRLLWECLPIGTRLYQVLAATAQGPPAHEAALDPREMGWTAKSFPSPETP